MLYPENLFNRVTYTYGKAGDKYNRAGRLALVEDASGGEAYYYGRQGEVTKTVRTVMASVVDIRTYVYGATYDSWNRVQTMTYPDGEVLPITTMLQDRLRVLRAINRDVRALLLTG